MKPDVLRGRGAIQLDRDTDQAEAELTRPYRLWQGNTSLLQCYTSPAEVVWLPAPHPCEEEPDDRYDDDQDKQRSHGAPFPCSAE